MATNEQFLKVILPSSCQVVSVVPLCVELKVLKAWTSKCLKLQMFTFFDNMISFAKSDGYFLNSVAFVLFPSVVICIFKTL